MPHLTRRQFLRMLALSTSASLINPLLTACAENNVLPLETRASYPTQTIAVPPPVETNKPSLPTLNYDLVVAKDGQPDEMVRRAITAFGGMSQFVPPGSKVVIKPNICVGYHSYEYAATTNPWVVGELVKLSVEAGAKQVHVFDHPFGGTAENAYAVSGIAQQVEAAGGKMIPLPNFGFISTDIPSGVDLKKCDIHDELLSADVVINVPIAKHHSLARLTLGMKNLMGVIKDRPAMHRNLGQRLADLTSRIPPTLTVVDAVRVLMANGPTGGSLDDVKQSNMLIVSPDIVAADSYAASIFGLLPDDLEYVRAAVDMRLGRSDLENLRVEEINIGL